MYDNLFLNRYIIIIIFFQMTLTMSATLVIVMATVMPNHFTRAWIVMKNVIFARKVTAHAKMVLLVSPMTSHL